MALHITRIKKIATPNNKSCEDELLTLDEHNAVKQVEEVRQHYSAVKNVIVGSISGCEDHKLSLTQHLKKKCVIGNTMLVNDCIGETSIFRDMLTVCGKLDIELAMLKIGHENAVHSIFEEVFPNPKSISNLKADLWVDVMDLDKAESSYKAAKENLTQSFSDKRAVKVSLLKTVVEQAQLKVSSSLEKLEREIYQGVAKEPQCAKIILDYAKSMRDSQRKSLELMEEKVRLLEAKWQDYPQKPIFGLDLDDHLRLSGRVIAYPIELSVCALYETAMDEKGLFRVAGGDSKAGKWKAAFDANFANMAMARELRDPFAIADVLKKYLRELPSPILCVKLHKELVAVLEVEDGQPKISALSRVVEKMPESHRCNIRYLSKFFLEVTRHSAQNLMTAGNLAIVLAPTLFQTESVRLLNKELMSQQAKVIELMITHADSIFPGQIKFSVTGDKAAPTLQPASANPSRAGNLRLISINKKIKKAPSPPVSSPQQSLVSCSIRPASSSVRPASTPVSSSVSSSASTLDGQGSTFLAGQPVKNKSKETSGLEKRPPVAPQPTPRSSLSSSAGRQSDELGRPNLNSAAPGPLLKRREHSVGAAESVNPTPNPNALPMLANQSAPVPMKRTVFTPANQDI